MGFWDFLKNTVEIRTGGERENTIDSLKEKNSFQEETDEKIQKFFEEYIPQILKRKHTPNIRDREDYIMQELLIKVENFWKNSLTTLEKLIAQKITHLESQDSDKYDDDITQLWMIKVETLKKLEEMKWEIGEGREVQKEVLDFSIGTDTYIYADLRNTKADGIFKHVESEIVPIKDWLFQLIIRGEKIEIKGKNNLKNIQDGRIPVEKIYQLRDIEKENRSYRTPKIEIKTLYFQYNWGDDITFLTSETYNRSGLERFAEKKFLSKEYIQKTRSWKHVEISRKNNQTIPLRLPESEQKNGRYRELRLFLELDFKN